MMQNGDDIVVDPSLNNSVIGIIDSGVGGLTVAKEVMRQLPRETIYYFGDTLRCPYGPRSPEEVRQYTFEMIHFLEQFPLKALLIACNTATAVALEQVQSVLSIPVLGVIKPGARAAIKATREGKIGVIGTQGTIRSQAYKIALEELHPSISVHSLACPTLVPLVENGNRSSPEAYRVVAEALRPFQNKQMDTLILGCTHYPLLADLIHQVMGAHVRIISSAEETASELSTILHHSGLLAQKKKFHRFFATGSAELFAKIASDWLGQKIYAEKVELSSYTLYRKKFFAG